MSAPRRLPSSSLDAHALAHFAAWLRAVRAGDAHPLAQAAAELHDLGMAVRPAALPTPAQEGKCP